MATSVSDLWRAQGSPEAPVLWDMIDGPMPRGLLGVGDPNVHWLDGRWTMFLGGFTTRFRNRLFQATIPAGAALSRAAWTFEADSRGRATALAPEPPRGAWDTGGMHTPCYVPAAASAGERIYYTGRANRKHYGSGSRYAIGVLERRDGEWIRRNSPVIVGDEDRPSALEPCVVYADSRYRMWYLANPHEVGPGEQPDYEMRYIESENGLTDWTPPVVFATVSDGFFDNTVVPHGEGWIMILARGSNLHGTDDFPAQGLWWTTARMPSGDRADWSEPRRLLDTDAPDTPARFGRGTYGPSLVFDDPSSTRATVFFTGTRFAPPWPRLTLRHLARLRRPPVPAPFYLSTGALEIDLA